MIRYTKDLGEREVTNRPVKCTFRNCNTQVQGKETIIKDRWGKIITECRWVCPRCGNLVQQETLSVKDPNKNESTKK